MRQNISTPYISYPNYGAQKTLITPVAVRAWGPYNNGCSQCLCTNDGASFCAFPTWCPHKCQVTNDDGVSGWVDHDTTLIHMPEEEGGCPKVRCKMQLVCV